MGAVKMNDDILHLIVSRSESGFEAQLHAAKTGTALTLALAFRGKATSQGSLWAWRTDDCQGGHYLTGKTTFP